VIVYVSNPKSYITKKLLNKSTSPRIGAPSYKVLPFDSMYTDDIWKLQAGEEFCFIYLDHPSRNLIEEDYSAYIARAGIHPFEIATHMKNLGCKYFIYAGSYWQEPRGTGYEYLNTYATSKQISQILLESMADSSFKITIVHLFDIYGEDDHRQKLVTKLFRGGSDMKGVEVHNPNNWISPIHISDVITGMESLINQREELPAFSIYSLPGPERFRVEDLSKDFRIKIINSKMEPKQIVAKSRFPVPAGWKPKIHFNLGPLV
jgi:nucleoside-diphosphate-sugar epimerase